MDGQGATAGHIWEASEMQFHVGPVAYTLVISDRSIFDEEGDELEGRAVESRRLLIISHRVEPERREDVALHEFKHAWQFHVPAPTTPEEDCQLFSLASRQFHNDLENQGGAEALRQLRPTRVAHTGRPIPQSSARRTAPDSFRLVDRVECGGCNSDVMCGSIINSTPALHEPTSQYRLQRWFCCDGCSAVQVWWEVCDADGTPLGQFVANPPPKMLRGADALRWLEEQVTPV